MLVGYIPVASADLLGAQTPETEYMFVYLTPFLASSSRWGVLATESPYDPRNGDMSSQVIIKIFGLSGNLISPLDVIGWLHWEKKIKAKSTASAFGSRVVI